MYIKDLAQSLANCKPQNQSSHYYKNLPSVDLFQSTYGASVPDTEKKLIKYMLIHWVHERMNE